MAQYTVKESSQLAGSLCAAAVCFQNARIKLSIENNQRAPADMVLQLLCKISGHDGALTRSLVTDTVYQQLLPDRWRQWVLRRVPNILTAGIHQTDFQRLRTSIKSGRFGIEEDWVQLQLYVPAWRTCHAHFIRGQQAQTSAGLPLFFCLWAFLPASGRSQLAAIRRISLP